MNIIREDDLTKSSLLDDLKNEKSIIIVHQFSKSDALRSTLFTYPYLLLIFVFLVLEFGFKAVGTSLEMRSHREAYYVIYLLLYVFFLPIWMIVALDCVKKQSIVLDIPKKILSIIVKKGERTHVRSIPFNQLILVALKSSGNDDPECSPTPSYSISFETNSGQFIWLKDSSHHACRIHYSSPVSRYRNHEACLLEILNSLTLSTGIKHYKRGGDRSITLQFW